MCGREGLKMCLNFFYACVSDFIEWRSFVVTDQRREDRVRLERRRRLPDDFSQDEEDL